MSVSILAGDIRDRLSEIPDGSVDVIVTDPPYGETALAWDKWVTGWPALVRRVLKPSGSMWVFGSTRMFMTRSNEFSAWHIAQDVVWEKHNGSGFMSDRFRRVHEGAVQFYPLGVPWSQVFKQPQFTNDATARSVRRQSGAAHWHGVRGRTSYETEDGGPRLVRSVIYCRSEHLKGDHPTQKPIAVVAPLVAYSCPPDGVVLDCFAGSGTTGICARRSGRSAILIEADPQFLAVMRSRLDNDAPLFAGQAA